MCVRLRLSLSLSLSLPVLVAAPRVRRAGVGDDDGVVPAARAGYHLRTLKRLHQRRRVALSEISHPELSALVSAPGEHSAVLSDSHAVRGGATAAHLRDGHPDQGRDARRLEDVGMFLLVLHDKSHPSIGEGGSFGASRRNVDE